VSFRRGRKRKRADEAGVGMGAARPGCLAPMLALQLRGPVRALGRPCSSAPSAIWRHSRCLRGFPTAIWAALGLGGGYGGATVVLPAVSSWRQRTAERSETEEKISA
jgi:hypothetical protein